MKKAIFMLAVGAMALTACSDTEVIEEGVQSPAIGFNTNVGKNSRAIDNDNFAQFFVYGTYKMPTTSNLVQVFDGEEVTKSEKGEWGYTNTRYWIDGATYTFAAYGVDGGILPGNNAQANFGTADGFLNLAQIEVDGATGHQKDIVYANSGSVLGLETNNPSVALAFKHILSRLDFTFKSGFPAGYTAEVTNVRLVSVRNTGRFMGQTLSWTDVDRTVDVTSVPAISLQFDETEISETKSITSGYAYVIPFEYKVKNVGIVFNLDVKNGNGEAVYGKEVSAYWAPRWAGGNTYSYTIILNGQAAGLDPIQFTGSVVDWATGKPSVPNFDIDPESLQQPEP